MKTWLCLFVGAEDVYDARTANWTRHGVTVAVKGRSRPWSRLFDVEPTRNLRQHRRHVGWNRHPVPCTLCARISSHSLPSPAGRPRWPQGGFQLICWPVPDGDRDQEQAPDWFVFVTTSANINFSPSLHLLRSPLRTAAPPVHLYHPAMFSFILLIPLIQLATLGSAQGITCAPDSQHRHIEPRLTTGPKS